MVSPIMKKEVSDMIHIESLKLNKEGYINYIDKARIRHYCKNQIENGKQIKVKSLACVLRGKYALYEITNYITKDLHINSGKIWRVNSDYLRQMPRGHWQLTTQDLYFSNCYLHQYIVLKELGIEIKQVKKYIIHHIDMDKSNNNIENLFIFYNQASHLTYHMAINHNTDTDIEELNSDYIESILDSSNAKEIKEYLLVLDKLKQCKKNKLSNANTKLMDI